MRISDWSSDVCFPSCSYRHPRGAPSDPYFSFRQLIDPRFSTLLDSISMSKPRSSRYLSVSTWPVPSSETPKPTYRRGEICFPTPSTLPPRARDSVTPASSRRSEEHTSELQSLMRIQYADF